MIDNGDILMCGVLKEKSGSTLLKLRLDKIGTSEMQGGATQNSNIQYKLKSQKQCQRDKDRFHQDKQKDQISSRTRSKIEISRCDEQNASNLNEFAYEVPSPETCVESPLLTETPELQYCASPPVMREIINTHDSCASPMDDSHKVDSVTDSHGRRIDSVTEVQDGCLGEQIQFPSFDMTHSFYQPEDDIVADSPALNSSNSCGVAEFQNLMHFFSHEIQSFRDELLSDATSQLTKFDEFSDNSNENT